MRIFGKSLVASLAVSVMAAGSAAAATPKTSGVSLCSRVTKAQAAALVGAGVIAAAASAKAIAATAGIAALEHSSGAFILSAVGVGGTGYIASTIGGAGVTALGWLSAPVVVPTVLTGGAIIALGAGGAYAYCRYSQ